MTIVGNIAQLRYNADSDSVTEDTLKTIESMTNDDWQIVTWQFVYDTGADAVFGYVALKRDEIATAVPFNARELERIVDALEFRTDAIPQSSFTREVNALVDKVRGMFAAASALTQGDE